MTDRDTHHELVVLFITAAEAHHAATGGVNAQWASWYAEHLADDVNRVTGRDLSVEELADWLTAADERYRAAEQDVSWPKAYATWMLATD